MRSLVLALLVIACAVPPPCFSAQRSADEYAARASEMLARADTSGAIDLLEHSHLDDHDNANAAVLLGRIWRELGTIDSRLRSQRVLEDARLKFPHDPDVLVELGRTYFAQRFFPDAIRCLQSALDIDPQRCEARYLIGLYYFRNWKRLNEYTDDLDTSRFHLRAAFKCDPGNIDAVRRYLYAGYALGDTSSRETDQILAKYPDDPCLHLYRGVLAYDAGQYDLCARQFDTGLSLLTPDRRMVYDDLSRVLPINVVNKYRNAGEATREIFRRAYWVSSDPDPTTAVNERELEHIYRVFVSDMLFSNDWTGRRGWNSDRGQAMIKYGRPLTINHTLGAGQDGHVETWTYIRGNEFTELLFVDEFLNGDPRIPYDDDFVLHNMLHRAEESTLPSSVASLDGTLAVSAFRDDDLHASLYVAMQVDADSLESRVPPASADHYVVRGALFDDSWQREGGEEDTLQASQLSTLRVYGQRVVQFVHRISIPFGTYRVAWSMQDDRARMRAVGRGDADARRFAADRLTLSDILIYDEPTEGDANADVIVRNGQVMRPRVGYAVRQNEPVRSYVEIYGLRVLDGKSAYEVRYSLFPGKDDASSSWTDWIRGAADALGFEDEDPVIRQSFRRETSGHEGPEYIAIDVSALDPGPYELVVEVIDLNAGVQTMQHRSITIAPGPRPR